MKFGVREVVFLSIILGLLGSSYFFLQRMSADRTVIRQANADKEKALAELQRSTMGISDLGRKITDLQKAIAFFESKLPQQKEMDKVLKEVWQLAEANSLSARSIKPGKIERAAHYSEQPIQMALSGDFRGFYSFLLALEKLPRITRVTQMQLSRIPDKEGNMHAQLTLSIFFEPDAGGAIASAR